MPDFQKNIVNCLPPSLFKFEIPFFARKNRIPFSTRQDQRGISSTCLCSSVGVGLSFRKKSRQFEAIPTEHHANIQRSQGGGYSNDGFLTSPLLYGLQNSWRSEKVCEGRFVKVYVSCTCFLQHF